MKDDEITRLKDRVKHLEKEVADKEKAASNIQVESEKLRKDIAAAEAKLSQSKNEFDNKLKDSRLQSDNKLKELGKFIGSFIRPLYYYHLQWYIMSTTITNYKVSILFYFIC